MRMTKTLRIAAVLSAVLFTTTLAGCELSAWSPTESPAPPTSTATPTPIETQKVDAEPDPEDMTTWVVSAEGMGPVQLGQPFADAVAAVPSWTVDENCSWAAFWNASDQSQSAYFARQSDDDDGVVTTIDVAALVDTVAPEDGPRTAEGIGLGSTWDQVMAAYPDAAEQQPTIGDETLLRTGEVFFAFPDPDAGVSVITVTSLDEPPYEVCA